MLVQVRDVEAMLRRQLTAAEDAVLPEVVELVEAEVSAEIRRPIEVETVTAEMTAIERGDVRVRLTRSPVVAVTTLEIETSPGTWATVDPSEYTVRSWGLTVTSWQPGTIRARVTYEAGLAVGAAAGYAALRSVIAGRVARILGVNDAVTSAADPTVVESISVEGYSVSYRPESAGRAWTDHEAGILAGFRRPLVL